MRLRLYIPVFLLLTVCVSVLADDDIKDLQKQQKKLEQQLQQTSEMLSQTKKVHSKIILRNLKEMVSSEYM